jgi:hypothetical protein
MRRWRDPSSLPILSYTTPILRIKCSLIDESNNPSAEIVNILQSFRQNVSIYCQKAQYSAYP